MNRKYKVKTSIAEFVSGLDAAERVIMFVV